ncbi:MAG TPA: dolichyl-phosphate beta-glucosyltransferase [Actinomycetes bacterium]|jgi:dolichyl-phosphate beta-glucosyltransferase|nr:dolichyl-phosphate beta-glucosyltransferase [Actinomycetes bacterium]
MSPPALSIVFPCFNEAGRLPHTMERYQASFPEDPAAVEFVIIDDGSTDSTFAVAEKTATGDPRVRVLRSEPNHGKGFAVRIGVLSAEGELVVFTDADGSYGPEQLARVVRALERAPVAIGSRTATTETAEGPAAPPVGPALRRAASRVFNAAMRLTLGVPFQDTQCGLKGFRRDAARALFGRARMDGFAFDAEILFLARRLGYEVIEVPVRATDRDGSKVRLAVDAIRMLGEVWSVRRAAARGAYDQMRVRDHAG